MIPSLSLLSGGNRIWEIFFFFFFLLPQELSYNEVTSPGILKPMYNFGK